MIAPREMALIHARAFEGQARAWTEPEFEALLETDGVLTIGDARGFVLSRRVLDEAEVLTLATDPDHRRQGIARGLLGNIEQQLRALGTTRQFLEVAAGNAPARALYAAMGYDQIALRRGYFKLPDGARDDAVILQKILI
ncbi:GNAT family N-acetyltransferase [Rhodobacteraceae bacterium KMM 6894]|nr:GNAT family N-acetyltransferase [Rhodobacteraceae bacterium KMM 6894]